MTKMKFELIVERCDNYTPGTSGFDLILANHDTGDTILLMKSNSMRELKRRGSDLFDGAPHLAGKRVQWCNGDDPDHDSCELFTLE